MGAITLLLWGRLVPLPTSDLSALERWAVFVAAIAAGMVALGAIGKRIRSAWRRLARWVREFIRRADALDKLVQHELHPNHGGSLHDKVTHNSQRLTKLEESVTLLADSQRLMWPAIQAVAEAKPPKHHDEETP